MRKAVKEIGAGLAGSVQRVADRKIKDQKAKGKITNQNAKMDRGRAPMYRDVRFAPTCFRFAATGWGQPGCEKGERYFCP
jgi:hypothetical protein